MSMFSFETILRIIEKVVKVLAAALRSLGIDDDSDETSTVGH